MLCYDCWYTLELQENIIFSTVNFFFYSLKNCFSLHVGLFGNGYVNVYSIHPSFTMLRKSGV